MHAVQEAPVEALHDQARRAVRARHGPLGVRVQHPLHGRADPARRRRRPPGSSPRGSCRSGCGPSSRSTSSRVSTRGAGVEAAGVPAARVDVLTCASVRSPTAHGASPGSFCSASVVRRRSASWTTTGTPSAGQPHVDGDPVRAVGHGLVHRGQRALRRGVDGPAVRDHLDPDRRGRRRRPVRPRAASAGRERGDGGGAEQALHQCGTPEVRSSLGDPRRPCRRNADQDSPLGSSHDELPRALLVLRQQRPLAQVDLAVALRGRAQAPRRRRPRAPRSRASRRRATPSPGSARSGATWSRTASTRSRSSRATARSTAR